MYKNLLVVVVHVVFYYLFIVIFFSFPPYLKTTYGVVQVELGSALLHDLVLGWLCKRRVSGARRKAKPLTWHAFHSLRHRRI